MRKSQLKIKPDDDVGEKIPDIINAAYAGKYELVKYLLNQGEDVNSVDPADNLSCLHIAGLQGDYALADLILDWNSVHGDVDFSIKSRSRPRLAWQFALNSNHPKLAEKLFRASRGLNIVHL